MKRTKFTAHEWHWTTATESLFDLSKEDLFTYRALIALL